VPEMPDNPDQMGWGGKPPHPMLAAPSRKSDHEALTCRDTDIHQPPLPGFDAPTVHFRPITSTEFPMKTHVLQMPAGRASTSQPAATQEATK